MKLSRIVHRVRIFLGSVLVVFWLHLAPGMTKKGTNDSGYGDRLVSYPSSGIAIELHRPPPARSKERPNIDFGSIWAVSNARIMQRASVEIVRGNGFASILAAPCPEVTKKRATTVTRR